MSRKKVSDTLITALFALSLFGGCTQEMATDGSLRPYVESRALPEGTVAREHVRSKWDDRNLAKNPLPMTLAFLRKGQERYRIYCAPCHGISGFADGPIVQRGFPKPPSYHVDRLRKASDGYIYGVITQGFGKMYSYADRLNVTDRWAIVAYIRALQFSQNAVLNRLPPLDRRALGKESP
jgi:cytochrome c553